MKALFMFVVLLLTGCSSQPTPTAYLNRGTVMTLPAPVLAAPFYRQQLLTASVGGSNHQLMTVLEADGHQLTLVGLTPSGVRLFLVRYDQQGIETRQLSPLLTSGMPPVSQVLADVMLCYWPLASWQPQLPPGWTLRDEGLQRRLRAPDGTLVTEIRYRDAAGVREPVGLQQHVFNYRLQLETLSQ
ncbi:DUF3261 domain-containing protein [Aeromonas dhakensis]|uniref:DUF3261 domain-containing protein n=1 Tax=Aeromonas dhakensis TaxID=196024 RepID=UPI00208E85E6|nr:DUF3261 domain-containing protein [Aeromonas dhakensis]USP10984.1 DUF3261 domain-containing protein [Aeromonas dhakensis]